jgi:DNA-binding NtrC family response regulator
MPARQILIVDDEELIRWSLAERLRVDGHDVLEAGTSAAAMARLDADIDAILLDYRLPDDDGVTLLRRIHEIDPDLPVIMLTAHKDVEIVVGAMRAGAFEYLTKPFDVDDVALRVERALEATRLRRELRTLRDTLARPFGMTSVIGESEAMQRVKALVRKVATSPGSTVLITGESGTGKDLLAKVIHYSSSRAGRPFLNITCSALPETLMESELFGHERGAFTDARAQKRGLLEQADEGTVFLDEIGEMTPALQAKLLRFLEEKAFRRVGGSADIHVDVRVIAATNRNLEETNVLRLEMPPLRARADDVPRLAQHFVETFSREFRRNVRGLSPEAEGALRDYGWPGNVRELRNLVERAVLLSEDERLQLHDFDSLQSARRHGKGSRSAFQLPADGVNLEDEEKSLVIQALERTGGNQTRAASLLGLHRDQIRYRIEKFGLAAKPEAK